MRREGSQWGGVGNRKAALVPTEGISHPQPTHVYVECHAIVHPCVSCIS